MRDGVFALQQSAGASTHFVHLHGERGGRTADTRTGIAATSTSWNRCAAELGEPEWLLVGVKWDFHGRDGASRAKLGRDWHKQQPVWGGNRVMPHVHALVDSQFHHSHEGALPVSSCAAVMEWVRLETSDALQNQVRCRFALPVLISITISASHRAARASLHCLTNSAVAVGVQPVQSDGTVRRARGPFGHPTHDM